MRITGGCHCGYVKYQAEIDPECVSICHCTDCQRLTGSAFRVTVTGDKAQFELSGDRPRSYAKLGDNGRRSLQYFCPLCGTPLYRTNGDDPSDPEIGFRWGGINERSDLAPRRQHWCLSQVPWLETSHGLPASAGD